MRSIIKQSNKRSRELLCLDEIFDLKNIVNASILLRETKINTAKHMYRFERCGYYACGKKTKNLCCNVCGIAFYCCKKHEKLDEKYHKQLCVVLQFINTLKCKLTGKFYVKPFKSKKCNHIYELDYLRYLFKSKNEILCPYPKCDEILKKDDFEYDYKTYILVCGFLCALMDHTTSSRFKKMLQDVYRETLRKREIYDFFSKHICCNFGVKDLRYVGRFQYIGNDEIVSRKNTSFTLCDEEDMSISLIAKNVLYKMVPDKRNLRISRKGHSDIVFFVNGKMITVHQDQKQNFKELGMDIDTNIYVCFKQEVCDVLWHYINKKDKQIQDMINQNKFGRLNLEDLTRKTLSKNLLSRSKNLLSSKINFIPQPYFKLEYRQRKRKECTLFSYKISFRSCADDSCGITYKKYKDCPHCKTCYCCSPEHEKNGWRNHKRLCEMLRLVDSLKCPLTQNFIVNPVKIKNECYYPLWEDCVYDRDAIKELVKYCKGTIGPLPSCYRYVDLAQKKKIYFKRCTGLFLNAINHTVVSKFTDDKSHEIIRQRCINVFNKNSSLGQILVFGKGDYFSGYIKYIGGHKFLPHRTIMLDINCCYSTKVIVLIKKFYKKNMLNLQKLVNGYENIFAGKKVTHLMLDINQALINFGLVIAPGTNKNPSSEEVIKKYFICRSEGKLLNMDQTIAKNGLKNYLDITITFKQDHFMEFIIQKYDLALHKEKNFNYLLKSKYNEFRELCFSRYPFHENKEEGKSKSCEKTTYNAY